MSQKFNQIKVRLLVSPFFLSLDIQKEQDKFCCIALTNPSEVVIVARNNETSNYEEIYRLADEEVFAKDSFSPHTEVSHTLSVSR